MQFYLKYEVYSQDCLLLEGVSPLLPSPPFFSALNDLKFNVIKET